MGNKYEHRRNLDHNRYMRQRDERLRKSHDIYHADIDASREYYRNYRKKRIEKELEKLRNNEYHFQQNND